MENTFITIGIVAVGMVMAFLGFRMSKKAQEESDPSPPENLAAGAARETVRRTFEEEVSAIKKDVEGDDPARDLAARGNTRRRR
tara:strand:+ start:1220 stop:1471 length:252 start_codon:yes stop_codon:yes gene_type:complete